MEDLVVGCTIHRMRVEDMTEEERALLDEARRATWRSYSPYSNFKVGAAVLLDDGTVVSGSNQENCAYPSGLCAERTAVFYANSRYPERRVRMICVAARGEDGEYTAKPVTPCGGCRQVLVESEKRQGERIRMMMYGRDELWVVDSVGELMPGAFGF